MECFVVIIVFLLLALLLSGIGAGLSQPGTGRAFSALTQRFGGTVHGGRWSRHPSVRFQYGPTWVTIALIRNRNAPQATRATLVWPDSATNLRIETYVPGQSLQGTPAAAELRTGDVEFDMRFRTTGTDEHAARKLLSAGVRWEIQQLTQLCDYLSLCVTFLGGRLTVEKPMHFRRPADLEQFTQLCLELFDQAMLTRSEGIEFMGSEDEAQLLEDPVCQVCGEPILADMVFCRRCRTPHHLDCWQYTGCCSTYGCREVRYAMPTVARPIQVTHERPADDDTKKTPEGDSSDDSPPLQ